MIYQQQDLRGTGQPTEYTAMPLAVAAPMAFDGSRPDALAFVANRDSHPAMIAQNRTPLTPDYLMAWDPAGETSAVACSRASTERYFAIISKPGPENRNRVSIWAAGGLSMPSTQGSVTAIAFSTYNGAEALYWTEGTILYRSASLANPTGVDAGESGDDVGLLAASYDGSVLATAGLGFRFCRNGACLGSGTVGGSPHRYSALAVSNSHIVLLTPSSNGLVNVELWAVSNTNLCLRRIGAQTVTCQSPNPSVAINDDASEVLIGCPRPSGLAGSVQRLSRL